MEYRNIQHARRGRYRPPARYPLSILLLCGLALTWMGIHLQG